ncbi:universal stress protein PHOS34-like [Macadamia integrifolia]|uniref:universal stress protein PHOS34-like n=1 Tax=Macadamia integrifolia TaxID=60698 RepID=UPI001C4F5E9B|nr:universal stress protein PHOS34-like [Macadamia integrifolia]XP_042516883.1 universal stress protein PHOS34-like [Macadamia integrifolia]
MATTSKTEKSVIVVGIDDSDHSYYALHWVLDHFFAPSASNSPFKLVVVRAMPSPIAVVGFPGLAGAADVLPYVQPNYKPIASDIEDRVKETCSSKSAKDVLVEVAEGDPRNVLCEAVEKHHASILVVGNHGYGAIKRAVLGSVSDYCAHHAHCSVMIVKKPKIKH